MLIFISAVLFNSILFTTLIFKCSRKRDTGPEIISTRTNNNISTASNRNTDREFEKMTNSQRAKYQAELDAAIEAEKKGHTKGTPATPINESPAMDGTLPISFKKPISEGRSKCEINQPVVWSIGHEEKKETKSAPERPKKEGGLKNFSEKVFKRKARSK